MSPIPKKHVPNNSKFLDESSNETVDILSHVFQFLEFKELFSLQKVSPFFYRTIEFLKSLLIRPIYEIGLVASNKTQLSEFVKVCLKSPSGLISSVTKQTPTYHRNNTFIAFDIDMTAKNDGDQLKNLQFGNHHIYAFEKIEKEFVFKKDRFRVFFFPLYCQDKTSLSHDDYNRLDGFIFLNPKEGRNGYSSMPNGCSFCATLLDHGFSLIPNEEVIMPVRKFGSFKIEKINERESIEKSIIDCVNYISENSDRSLHLNNAMGDGLKTSLLDKIESLIREPINEKVSEMVSDLFKNRFTLKELLLSEKVRYMTRKLNFFNLPHNIQFSLLQKLYTVQLGRENVTIKDDLHCIKVMFYQYFNFHKDLYPIKKETVEMHTTLSFNLISQEIEFKYIESGSIKANKCVIC